MSLWKTVDIRPSLSMSGVPYTGKEGINSVCGGKYENERGTLQREPLVYPKFSRNALQCSCKRAM